MKKLKNQINTDMLDIYKTENKLKNMKKNNSLYSLTDYKIKSIGYKLPKTASKYKHILLKQIEKLHIECKKELEKTKDILHFHLILDKYKRLTKPLWDCLLEIIKLEKPFIILERKE